MKCLWILAFLLLAVGCVHRPTEVSESDLSFIDRAYNFEKSHRPIHIDRDTVVLDVRAFFDYQISRLPGALNVDIKDFSIAGFYGSGLEDRAVQLSRRLALMGVTPFSHVVVVGYGDKSQGEEGIVALTLTFLGVEQVQIGNLSNFDFMLTSKVPEKKENKRYWEPRLMTSLLCSPLADQQGYLIDVTNKKLPSSLKGKNIVHTKMKWKDFINTKDFSPSAQVITKLQNYQIQMNSQIMIRGYQAPIVAFSLLRLGYNHVCIMDK